MCGNRVFLAFAGLLVTANARPDGYGVKGGIHHGSAANAFASAHATANAVARGVGIAQSSATATANADSRGNGAWSSADATADASIDGGNIGKAIGENANGNVNGPFDSDNLHQSNVRGKGTEYETISDVEGSTGMGYPIGNSGHAESEGDTENSGQTPGLGHDHRRCGIIPEGVKGHGGVSRCQAGCKEKKPDVFNPFLRKPDDLDLSTGSQHSMGIDGNHGGISQTFGNTGVNHAERPCAAGDSNCHAHKPSVSNPYPTYEKNPDASAGSSSFAGIDGGYGGNSPKPGTGGVACAPGSSNCHAHKPSVSNPYPTYEKNPDSSAGSSSSAGIAGGYGGNSPKPGTGGVACAPGDSNCHTHKPSISNPYPTYEKNPDSSAGSSSFAGIAGGYGGNSPKPGTGGVACTPGDSTCFANKPSVSNPYPTYGKNPDSSAGSSSSAGIAGGYGGSSPKPGTGGVACAPGDSNCHTHKPSISNPYPTYEKNPDASAGSSSSAGIAGGYGGSSPKPGTGGVACAPGGSNCHAHKPSISNPYPTYEKNPDASAGSSSSAGIAGGYGGNSPKPGTGGVACAPGDSNCHAHKPSISNPYPTYEKNPDSSAGSSSFAGIAGGYGGNSPKPGTGGVACAPGDSNCHTHKPSISNPYPTYEKNPDASAGSSSSAGIAGGYGGHSPKPGTGGVACAPGDSNCYGHKPSVSNPYPMYETNPDSSAGSSSSAGIDGGYGGNSPKPGTGGVACAPGDSNCHAHKPSVSNPYPTYEKNPDSSAGSSSFAGIAGGYGGNSPKPGTGGVACAPGDSNCHAHKPSISNPYPTYEKNPDASAGSSSSAGIAGGYGGNSPTPGTGGVACAPGDFNCHAHKPSISNPYPTYEKNPDASAGSSSSAGIAGGYGEIGPIPGSGSIHSGSPCASGDSKCFPHKPTSGNARYPDASSGKSQHTSNPFLNGQIDLSGIKNPSHSGGSKPNLSNPFLNGKIDLSGIQHPTDSGRHPDSKPNPSNPFFNPHSQVRPATGTNYPGVPSPTTNCHGSVSCSPNESSGGPGAHGPTDFPRNQPGEPNPFLVDGHLIKPGSHGTSALTPDNVPGQNPLLAHNEGHFSSNTQKPKIIEGCQDGSSTGCSGHKPSSNSDVQGSVIQGDGNTGTLNAENWAVKGHKSGVKGDAGYWGSPIKSQGNSGLGGNGHSDGQLKGSAWSTANASASASAHAYASSSSFSDGGQPNANAKSEAYSRLDNPSYSNAWSSSSASASASAFANSSSFHGSWTAPVLPDVPAE